MIEAETAAPEELSALQWGIGQAKEYMTTLVDVEGEASTQQHLRKLARDNRSVVVTRIALEVDNIAELIRAKYMDGLTSANTDLDQT